jgi:hypothetical protein
MGSPVPATGAWWALDAIFKDQQLEFETWEQVVVSDGGLSCPVCGEPLSSAPPSTGSGRAVSRFCRFAGDHRYEAPGDVVAPQPGVRMGRYG